MLCLLLEEKSSPTERHEVTGINITITSLHLLLTARLEHVRREPHICWHPRPEPAPLLDVYKRIGYCHAYLKGGFSALPRNRQH